MSRRSHFEVQDATVQCPCCWENVTLEVDPSAGSQTYTEDCTVCCNPMLVRVLVDDDTGEVNVSVEGENG